MLNDLIQQEFIRSWHRGTLFAPHLNDFLDKRAAQGFGPPMLRAKLCAVTFFGDFLRQRGVDEVRDITDEHAAEFIAGANERIRGTGVSIVRSAIDADLRAEAGHRSVQGHADGRRCVHVESVLVGLLGQTQRGVLPRSVLQDQTPALLDEDPFAGLYYLGAWWREGGYRPCMSVTEGGVTLFGWRRSR